MVPSGKKKQKETQQQDPYPYLDSIATEILIKIFFYLPTKDLISIAQTCTRFSEIANDKTLLRTIDLRSCYGFKWSELSKFLRHPSRKLVIQHVRLDNCYWLDWSHDTRFLRSCPKLRSLTLLGVPVTFSQLVPVFHACKQITHLAVSFNGRADELEAQSGILSLNSIGAFTTIKKLDLTLDTDSLLPPHHFWDTFHNLEELSLLFTDRLRRTHYYEDTLFSFKPRGIDDNRLPKLHKFVTNDITGKLLVSMYSPTERKQFADIIFNRNLDRAFLQRWTTRRHLLAAPDSNGNAVCGPSCAILYRVPCELQPWPGLQHLALCLHGSSTSLASILCRCPWLTSLVMLVTEDTQQSSLAAAVSESVPRLQQLCLMKRDVVAWGVQLQDLVMPALTHLSLPCTALCPLESNSNNGTGTVDAAGNSRNGFKRSRLGVTDTELPEQLPLSRALAACPLLLDLELGVIDQLAGIPTLPPRVACESLNSIRLLQHLTCLSLQNLPLRTGQCLPLITSHCKQLRSLRLKDLGPSGLCCYTKHLVQALQSCQKLQDLRVEQHALAPCRELLQAITAHCHALQRLVIISPTPSYTSFLLKDVIDLVKSVGSLVFALLQTSYITQRDEQAIARVVKKLQRSRPELVVLNSLNDEQRRDRRVIPLSHLTEMVDVNSWARQHNVPPTFR